MKRQRMQALALKGQIKREGHDESLCVSRFFFFSPYRTGTVRQERERERERKRENKVRAVSEATLCTRSRSLLSSRSPVTRRSSYNRNKGKERREKKRIEREREREYRLLRASGRLLSKAQDLTKGEKKRQDVLRFTGRQKFTVNTPTSGGKGKGRSGK